MNNFTTSSTTIGNHIFPSDRIISYVADGTVCQFSFPFIVWEQGGILVYLADGVVDPSSYSVTGLGSDTGGMVTFSTPPADGTTVTILGNTPRERAVDYNDYVTLRAAAMNLDANYQEAQIQENSRQLKRALLTPPSDGVPETPMALPAREERKNSYLAFDGDGNPVALGDSANLVKGMADIGTTPGAVMTWKDGTGLQADDSFRIFGQPNGAATLNSEGVVPDDQLPPLGTMASQDADSVTITGGTIAGIIPLAVADGGTGADTAAGARTNLGAVPTTRTVNSKALSTDITLGASDVGAVPTTRTVNDKPLSTDITLGASDVGALADSTAYGASLTASGRDISLLDQDGETLSTVQTQDIAGKLDKQAVYTTAGVTSTFFHEADGGGYKLMDTNDDSISFIGGNADPDSPIKVETYAKTVADNVGTRIIQTLEKIYYTAGNSSSTFGDGDEVAVRANIPTALSSLTNDGNFVTDASYVHTDNNFTTSEKTKLAGLDDNHFKGSYPSLTALETAHPTASDGDYAYVGTAGTQAVMYLWDVTDSEWVLGGSPAGETPASVKEKYESNADTNAFTDDDVAMLATIGDVDDLTTTAKDTAVDAINELVTTFSSYVPTTRTVNSKALSANITLSNSDIGSEPAITAAAATNFWAGDKSWKDFGDSVRATLLTGLSTSTNTAIVATDTTIVALGKLQAQVSSSGFPNPMTAPYDIIYSKDDLGTPERLPIGDANTFLQAKISPSGTPDLGYETSTVTLNKNVTGAAYGNGYYVFCGQDTIGYTSDITTGITSTHRFPWSSFYKLRFLNGYFIATCSDGKVFYASDPTTSSNWTQVTISSSAGNIIDVVFFGGYYVCASDNGGIFYSSALTSWSSKSVGITSLTGIACNDDHIGVVNGTDFSYCDTVTGTWSVVSSIGVKLGGLAAGNGYWVTVDNASSDSLTTKYSSNLTSWVTKTSYSNSSLEYGIDFCNGYFVFAHVNYYYGNTYDMYYATDPSGSWTSAGFARFAPQGVTYANGYYIFLGNVQSIKSTSVVQLPPYYDTTLATTYSSPLPIAGFQGTEMLRGVVRYKTSSKDCWFFVGDYACGYTDSLTTTQSTNSIFSYSLRDICWGGYDSSGNRYMVMCGKNGTVIYSTSYTLSSLSVSTSGTTSDLNSIAYGKNRYVAVGNNGTIVISPDLNVGFVPVSSGTTANLYKVRFLGNQFLAVGNNVILSSNDGEKWTVTTSSYLFNDIAYDARHGIYIAVGKYSTGGVVGTRKTMATSWNNSTSFLKPLYTVSVVGDEIVVAGAQGYASKGTYNNGSTNLGYDFSDLSTGVTGDITAMAWTDEFVGSLVCEDGVFGLNGFSGGVIQALQYSPVPQALPDIPGIVQPDNATTFVGPNGTLSAMAGSLKTERYITNCVLEAYGNIIRSPSDSGSIYVPAGTRVLVPNGRNANGTLRNIDYTFASATRISVNSAGKADTNRYLFLVFSSGGSPLTTASTNSQSNVIVSTTTPTISTSIGPTVDWFNPDDNLWRRTTNSGSTWTTVIQMPIARYDCSSSAIMAVRGRKVSEMLNNFDAHRIAGWSVPGDRYIDITYGASGDTYTSPGDGWIYLKCTTQNTNAYILGESIVNEETGAGVYGAGATTYSANKTLYLLFPVGANYAFKMYNSNLNVNVFRFIYGKGAL